ncbi:copper resistance system multicopper oxidase [Roseomonas sp. M0104]|uniref:Copper resistance system multicopper oxidase n=1 Tax=Teichococcus coralli TaxID=2545983 RepID=A0A845BJ25_9PROT|nr:copper resistance system multicopper oxidase [Pseudoroseomonas coralli]MXP65297.1 copper resistance system multicopper oxidase [Pseudoroseomonas coralli]
MTDQPTAPQLGRRRFVQGAAALGAGLASGALSRPAFALTGAADPSVLSGTRFDLTLDRAAVNKTGTEDWGNTINGGIPGPALRWRQGDVVTLNVTNNLPELTGIHWHGIILPNPMDGVPGLAFPGIQPGETFTYRFPVVQSGTYWYHSHMSYQEQKGAYGALIIEPEGQPHIQVDRDYVVVLSDWMDGSPLVVQNNLKQMSDYYNFNRRTLGSFVSDVNQSGLGMTVAERARWANMRMDPSGITQPTAALYTYLMNGQPPSANWTALFRPGESVRLRFINASAITYYDVSIPGLEMDVVHVHGNDVVPVTVDQLRIPVAETYDVVVRPRQDRAFTIFAQDMERSGFARGTLAPRMGMSAPVPPMDPAPMRTMADMGKPGMAPDQVAASHPDRTRIGGIMPSKMGEVPPEERARRPGRARRTEAPPETQALKPGVELQFVAKTPTDRLDLPGDGLDHLMGQRRILTLADLRSVNPGLDKRPPTREIVLNLTGNMHRFIWGFDGKKFTEVGPIDVTLGERFRLRFVNNTMMSHPIHLHGMWMELENDHGEHRPYLHTINVKPSQQLSLLVTPLATGQWPLHCHLLYHFEAGMFRTLRVLPRSA